MLTIITGRAGSGKTAAIVRTIAEDAAAGRGRSLLIVPEQYSHEAERELCAVCGDRQSLYAEVMSFTGLARAYTSRYGGSAEKVLDKGGRLLCMARALSELGGRLEVYKSAVHMPELQQMLLKELDQLKTACVDSRTLEESAALFSDAHGNKDSLGKKLHDLHLIAEMYEAVAARGHLDPTDRMTLLAEQIGQYGTGDIKKIYIDGFTDFTGQEHSILRALMKCGADLTVCLTIDTEDPLNEVYELSRRAAARLAADARETDCAVERKQIDNGEERSASLTGILTDNLYGVGAVETAGTTAGEIQLFSAGGVSEECELAAGKVLELVREHGYRWRDIAVAVRGFEDYRPLLESFFRYYEIPFYASDRRSMLSRPLPALIESAFRILDGGWDVDDVTAYLRTGLTGLNSDECDKLEGYIFLWQLRAGAWSRSDDWHQHPDGYNGKDTPELEERLAEINALRRRVAGPLKHFEEACAAADTASGCCRALAGLLQELNMAQVLAERADRLEKDGNARLAGEYAQMWEICVSALEQSNAILGDAAMDTAEFGRLFTLTLSAYDIGTIPVSLDRVTIGDFDRMRRRHLRGLVVIGASDTRLPPAEKQHGVFSREELRRLAEQQIDVGQDEETDSLREFSLIYNCLSLPSDDLIMSYPLVDPDGEAQEPAFVMRRASELFGLKIRRADMDSVRLSAPGPALAAAAGGRQQDPRLQAAAEYFSTKEPERWERLKKAASVKRMENLSARAVAGLYGSRFRLGASRIESFDDCRFGYFCKFGLKAEPTKPADYSAPEMGTFMHYILENTARDAKARGGFKNVSDEEIRTIVDHWVEVYVRDNLSDFKEKSPRFVYLFRRLEKDTRAAVTDMARELRSSDFEPIAFEYDFDKRQSEIDYTFGEGENKVTLTGIADRIDGWEHDGKLYLRVADYKSGPKTFALSDAYNGANLQMLLYLFAIAEHPGRLLDNYKGDKVLPAGVMYVPIRDRYASVSGAASIAESADKHVKNLRRSGLVVDDPEILKAWEHPAEDGKTRYIPVTFGPRSSPQEKLADAAKLGILQKHIESYLSGMAAELKKGSIDARPRRLHNTPACRYCDYAEVCGIGDDPHVRYRDVPGYTAREVWELLGCADAPEEDKNDV